MIELRPFQSASAILDAPLRRFLNEPGTWLAQTHQLFQGVAMKRKRDWIDRAGYVPRASVLMCMSRAPERQPHTPKQRDACDHGSYCEEDFDVYGHVIVIGR